MDQQFVRKNIVLLIFISFVVLFSLIFILNLLQKRSQPLPGPTPTTPYFPSPTSIELSPVQKTVPQSIRNAPTYPPDQGQGIDLGSQFTQTSIAEVQKLYPHLPYLKDYTLSTGLAVSIVIPAKDLQYNPWSLTVQIFGIDYELPPDDPEYQRMKTSFLEAANTVFEWIRSNGADPQKIIVSWGDKAFIQDQAEEWLQ